jgi:hypothetical protein
MIDTINAEIEDYSKQIQEAQQQVQYWTQKGLMASGALQACQALKSKLEQPITEVEPAA